MGIEDKDAGVKHELALGMELTLYAKGGPALTPGAIFTEMGATPYFQLGRDADVELAASSGACEGVIALVMAMAAEGLPVWKDEFKRAIENAVENLSQELH